MSELLVQSSALEGKFLDKDSAHSVSEKLVLSVENTESKPVGIELHHAESHKDARFRTIGERAAM